MLIVYTGVNGEVIVTTSKREHRMLVQYFGPEMDRDLEDYDRVTSKEPAAVFSSHINQDY